MSTFKFKTLKGDVKPAATESVTGRSKKEVDEESASSLPSNLPSSNIMPEAEETLHTPTHIPWTIRDAVLHINMIESLFDLYRGRKNYNPFVWAKEVGFYLKKEVITRNFRVTQKDIDAIMSLNPNAEEDFKVYCTPDTGKQLKN
jgi:ribosomal protein S19